MPPGRSNTLHLDWLAASGIAGTIEKPIAWTSNMTARPDVQDNFLRMLVHDKTAVSVFLVNGIRLSGQLAAFDQFVVLLESGSGSQLVFKHAISTVLPVNGREPARDPTEVPVSGDRSNHSRARVR
jgi:host factor-I protein